MLIKSIFGVSEIIFTTFLKTNRVAPLFWPKGGGCASFTRFVGRETKFSSLGCFGTCTPPPPGAPQLKPEPSSGQFLARTNSTAILY